MDCGRRSERVGGMSGRLQRCADVGERVTRDYVQGRGLSDRCSWFDCDKKSEVYFPRGNSAFCEAHYLLNVLRFGCDLEGKAIKEESGD